MSRVKVLNTYWGASREEVRASEEGSDWELQEAEDRLTLQYKGEMFRCEGILHYRFSREGAEGEDIYRLISLDYCLYETCPKLYENIQKVLNEKHGEPVKDCAYHNPTWITDNGQTAIELRRDNNPDFAKPHVYVEMQYNGEDVPNRKIDYFDEALKRF